MISNFFFKLFVVVVSVGGKDVHVHLGFEDTVDKAVLLGDFAAPAVRRLPFQGFRVAGAGLGWVRSSSIKRDAFAKALGSLLANRTRSILTLSESLTS